MEDEKLIKLGKRIVEEFGLVKNDRNFYSATAKTYADVARVVLGMIEDESGLTTPNGLTIYCE